MFIATKIWFDPETFLPVVWDGYEYDGPVDECKKGRETVEKNSKIGQDEAIAHNANSKAALDRAQNALQLDLGSSTPGSLTPAANAQLAADRANIGRTYNGMRQAAFATLGQRGMGNAPSGFSVAANNGLNVGQEGAETGAYRNAQVGTERQRNFATSTEAGLAGQEGSLGNQSLSGSTAAAVDRSQMGSTLGDVAGGIAMMAPIVAAPFTHGASLAGMAGLQPGTKMWGNIGKNASSGIGSYGSSGIGSNINPMNPVYG